MALIIRQHDEEKGRRKDGRTTTTAVVVVEREKCHFHFFLVFSVDRVPLRVRVVPAATLVVVDGGRTSSILTGIARSLALFSLPVQLKNEEKRTREAVD